MGWSEVSNILMLVSSFSIVLPFGAALLCYKKNEADFQVLTWLFVIGLVFEVVFVTTSFYGKNNHPLVHLFTVIEYLFFAYMFYRHLQSLRMLIATVSVLFVFFAIINAVYIQNIWSFDTNSHTIESILLITYALIYYYTLLKGNQFEPLFGKGMYWIATGVLLYFSLNLFFFMLDDVMEKNAPRAHQVSWIIHSFNNILANCMFAKAFLCKPLSAK